VLPASGFVLSLDSESEGLVLLELARLPRAFEEVEPEVAPEGLFDHIAVAPAAAGSLDAHRSENALVESDSRPRFRHKRIIAS
jgi:hypothetical protein